MVVPYPFPTDRYRLVGKVTRAHGLKGELKIVCLSEDPEQFRQFSRVALVATDGRMTAPLDVIKVRRQGKLVILKLDTIDTRNEADLTAGMGVLLPDDQPLAQSTNRLAAHRLRGLTVRTVAPATIVGTVSGCFDNGAQQIMVVYGDDREVLIPLVPEIIVRIDERDIVIDPPPGLLDLYAPAKR